jgi:hypothetical protein
LHRGDDAIGVVVPELGVNRERGPGEVRSIKRYCLAAFPLLPLVQIVIPQREGNMAKSTRNTGKRWSKEDVSRLRNLAKQNTPTRVIGLKLGRTEDAVRAKASEKNIPLKPTNQSPYGRKK